jgi:hypothetical protein
MAAITGGRVQQIVGLTAVPVRATCPGWIPETVSTSSPTTVPHAAYFRCELGADAPLLVALTLSDGEVLYYQRFWRSAANVAVSISLAFFPYDWSRSDAVQLALSQQVRTLSSYESGVTRASVLSEALKRDPRQFVVAPVLDEPSLHSGGILDLAVINLPTPWYARLTLVLKSDTEPCRGRWRLKRSLTVELPSQLSFLREGRCSGSILL